MEKVVIEFKDGEKLNCYYVYLNDTVIVIKETPEAKFMQMLPWINIKKVIMKDTTQ